jgi:hypothetical protein
MATNEYLNTWGERQNANQLDLIDEAIAGFVTKAVSGGAVSLTSANYATDEARRAIIKTTGTGGALTVPAVTKAYVVHNACSGVLTVGCGGVAASLQAGEIVQVYCDGFDCYRALPLSFGNQRLRSLADPVDAQDAATRAYVLAQLGAVSVAPWSVKTAHYVAAAGDRLICNTAGGAFTVTLPGSPVAGAEVTLMDANSNWDTAAVTVARNGLTIAGLAEDLTCNVPAVRVHLVYTGATWAVG